MTPLQPAPASSVLLPLILQQTQKLREEHTRSGSDRAVRWPDSMHWAQLKAIDTNSPRVFALTCIPSVCCALRKMKRYS